MVDIGTSDKLINLWPSPASRTIEKSAQKKNSSKQQQHNKDNKTNNKVLKDGPGKNIDEYV